MPIVALLLPACNGSAADQQEANGESDSLYHASLNLIAAYTDSLRLASDSAAVNETFQRFQQELDSLNQSVPPDTDLLLTEGENDTIYMRITTLREIYNSRLKSFEQRQDSVEIEEIEE